jgi:hypothetical protein
MSRKENRRKRAAIHRAAILSDVTNVIHTVKSDGYGFWYPIPCGTGKRTRNTSAEIRTKVILQRIDSGRPKGKRTIRYTTCIAWQGRHPLLSKKG